MDFLDLTIGSAAENVALDEALLLQAERGEGGELLRIWEWPDLAVVLGAGCVLAGDVEVERCQADGVPVLRRSSGGGTVLLGQGCLCFTLVLRQEDNPALEGIRTSYEYILGGTVRALGVPGVELAGISDLARHGWKFSGNAQQRKRRYLLHHGTLLYRFDLSCVPRYLRQPARQPEYREGRAHEDFICNLEVDRGWLVGRLRAAWDADAERREWPAEAVRRLVEEKYGKGEWTARR